MVRVLVLAVWALLQLAFWLVADSVQRDAELWWYSSGLGTCACVLVVGQSLAEFAEARRRQELARMRAASYRTLQGAEEDARERVFRGLPPNPVWAQSAQLQRQWEDPQDYFDRRYLELLRTGAAV